MHRLTGQLPPGCAVHRALFGDQAPWSLDQHMLADVIDILNAANWQRAQSKTAPRPKPVPRPDARKALRGGGDASARIAARRAEYERRRMAHLRNHLDAAQTGR